MKRISSAATSSRLGSAGSPSTISRSTQGLPCTPRPTMTAAAPVEASPPRPHRRGVEEWRPPPLILGGGGGGGARRVGAPRLDGAGPDLGADARAVLEP